MIIVLKGKMVNKKSLTVCHRRQAWPGADWTSVFSCPLTGEWWWRWCWQPDQTSQGWRTRHLRTKTQTLSRPERKFVFLLNFDHKKLITFTLAYSSVILPQTSVLKLRFSLMISWKLSLEVIFSCLKLICLVWFFDVVMCYLLFRQSIRQWELASIIVEDLITAIQFNFTKWSSESTSVILNEYFFDNSMYECVYYPYDLFSTFHLPQSLMRKIGYHLYNA